MRSEKKFNDLYLSISKEVTKSMLKEKAVYERKRQNFMKNFCFYFYGILLILIFIWFHMTYGSIREMIFPFLIIAVFTEAALLLIASMIYPARSRSINAQFKGVILQRIANSFGFKHSYISPMKADDFTESGFDTNFDFFKSEDYLFGTLDNGSEVMLSEIALSRMVRDQEGNYSEQTTYEGVYAKVLIPNAYYATMELKQNDITKTFSKSRVEMESSEFEKKYDILAENRMQALKVFDPEVIQSVLKADELGLKQLQIKIRYGTMYIRFPRKIFLEMKGEGSFLRNDIKAYYDEMGIIFDLIEKITDSVIRNCNLDRSGN